MTIDPVQHVSHADHPGIEGKGIVDFLFWPTIESVILIGAIQLLSRLKLGTAIQVIGSAALMSSLHSVVIPIWGLLVLPLFMLDGVTFVCWRQKSVRLALAMVVVLHILSNGIATLDLFAARYHPHRQHEKQTGSEKHEKR